MLKQSPDSYLHCVVHEWQQGVDLLARICNVPSALIMHTDGQEIEVFVSSKTENNPYIPGDHDVLKDSGLYCEYVIRNNESLLVPNALKDSNWDQNPDIKLGMISYLGFPIKYPNGDVFGTLCILDTKENRHSKEHEKLMEHFRNVIEISLESISQHEQTFRREQAEGPLGSAIGHVSNALDQVDLLSEHLRSGESIKLEELAVLQGCLRKCTELLQGK